MNGSQQEGAGPQSGAAVDDGRESFESLLVRLSARFINLQPEQVDAAIEDALRQVCEWLSLDLAAVFQWESRNRDVFLLTHLYRPLGGPPVPDRMLATDYFPWSWEQAQAQQRVVVESMEQVPEAAARDRESWMYYGVKAVVNVPLAVGSEPTFGVVGFCDTRAERAWPESLLNRMELVGQVIANALARRIADEKLRLSEERLKLAADSAGAGLWSLDLATRRFWITPTIRDMHGYATDEEVTFERFFELVDPGDQPAVQQALDSILQDHADVQVEYRITLSGKTRWLAARGRLHRQGEDQSECSVMGVTIDVTDRKENEMRLKQALNELGRLHDRLAEENDDLRSQLKRDDGQEAIIGESEPVLRMIAKAQQVSSTGTTVLVTGETGTGKELLAQAIHNLSPRSKRPMIKVNCAALPPPLVEGELFGREKGAYTGAMTRQQGRFEAADGSTLFLDEIGDLPLELQSKLLRVLQDGSFERLGSTRTITVDVRVITATNRDLAAMVREGAFREDLYHRLNVFPIEVPPLRERSGDIPLMVWTFVQEFNRKMGRAIDSIPRQVMEQLKACAWPGNVRELRNVVERAMIVSDGRSLNVELPKGPRDTISPLGTLDEVEREHILAVLAHTHWRISGKNGAAEILGMVPTTLHSRMKKLGIRRPDSQ